MIWKGDQLIEGVPETLDLLRKMVCATSGNICLVRCILLAVIRVLFGDWNR